MSSNPARIAGLSEHGNALAVGAPANLTLVDPAARITIDRDDSVSLSRNNPWHGRELSGAVHATYLRGVATVLEGRLQ
jgi:dihydroorotase